VGTWMTRRNRPTIRWLFVLAGLVATAVALIRAIAGGSTDLAPLGNALAGNDFIAVVGINWRALTRFCGSLRPMSQARYAQGCSEKARPVGATAFPPPSPTTFATRRTPRGIVVHRQQPMPALRRGGGTCGHFLPRTGTPGPGPKGYYHPMPVAQSMNQEARSEPEALQIRSPAAPMHRTRAACAHWPATLGRCVRRCGAIRRMSVISARQRA
jgi:hypothetical protein